MSVVMPVSGKTGFPAASWPVVPTFAKSTKGPVAAVAEPASLVPTARVVDASALASSVKSGVTTPAPPPLPGSMSPPVSGYPGSSSPPFPGSLTPAPPGSLPFGGKTRVLAPTAKATQMAPTTTMVPATANSAAPVVTATYVKPPSSGTEPSAGGMVTPVVPGLPAFMSKGKTEVAASKAGSATTPSMIPFMTNLTSSSRVTSPIRRAPAWEGMVSVQSPRLPTGMSSPMSPTSRFRPSGLSTPLSPPPPAPVFRLSTPGPPPVSASGSASVSIPRASYIAAPTTQPSDMDTIEREKQFALANLATQFQQAADVISKQAELANQELTERIKLESERFNLEVDRELHAQAKLLDEQTNSAIMRLQQSAALQKAQLEQQATRMIQDYEAQKAEEDMMRRQTEIQRQYSTSQGHLSEQARGLQERATAHEKLRQEQERLTASLPEPFRALGTPAVSRQTSGVLRQTSGVLRQTSGVLRQTSGVLPQANTAAANPAVFRQSSGTSGVPPTTQSQGPGVVRQTSGVVIQTLADKLPQIVEMPAQIVDVSTASPPKTMVERQTSGVLR